MIDTTGALGGIDGMSENDNKVYEFQKQPLADEFLYGWVPGNFEFKFPKGFGKNFIRMPTFFEYALFAFIIRG